MNRIAWGWAILLAGALLLGALLGGTTGLAGQVSGTPVTPEPFPFSDRYPAEVVLHLPQEMATLARLGIDVGDVSLLDGGRRFPGPGEPFKPLRALVYINQAEADRLAQEGLVARPIPNESMEAFRRYGPGVTGPDAWPTFEEFVARMQGIADTYPNLVRMVSIGQSVQGRNIWLLKISDNPDLEEDEPEFKYTSTMHGDEAVGVEMTIRLAELLTGQYGLDPDLTELVDEMEIWLCPIHNPDGYVNGSRYNAHGEDLNRDFPDRITDPNDDPAGREPETQAFMYFGYDHHFVMGANYHGGAAVVNFPWDSVPNPPDYAPDDAIFYDFSVGYAIRNPMIWNGGFPNGVTRGWEWYIIRGGMQDWAYHWRWGEHHVTIELGNTKKPPYSQMDTYWNANREAMLWWMRRALTGVRGLVYDAVTGQPLDATVDVVEIGKPVRTDPDVGDYHRLLLPGTWTLVCSAEGYLDQTWTVEVISGPATVQDCALLPAVAYNVIVSNSEVVGPPGETVTHTFSLTNVGSMADSYTVALTPGAWPALLLDDQVGPLDPLQVGQVRVVVEIPDEPATAALLATDVLTLQVTSVATPLLTVWAEGVTHAVADLSLALAADAPRRAALPGRAVTYTLAVTNTGSYTDSYTFSLAGNAWPTQVTPAQTPLLGPGAVAQAWVRVDIPAAPAGPTDGVTVTAASGWDAAVFARQHVETEVVVGLEVALAADQAGQAGWAGQTVTYTLLVTNSGDYTDTYALSLAGNAWPAQTSLTQTQPLGPGQVAQARLWVTIPAGPGGEADTVTVRATSGWDGGAYAELNLVTARLWRVYLPLILRAP